MTAAPYRRRSIGGGAFAPWQSLGGYLTSVPAVTGNGPTSRLFARGGDNALYVQPISNGDATGRGRPRWRDHAEPGRDLGYERYVRPRTRCWTACSTRGASRARGRGGSNCRPSCSVPTPAVAAPVINSAPAAPAAGLGFDACEAPSTAAMATWRLYSPYTTVGIYIGGVNRACPNPALDSSVWLNTARAQGWRSIPIYVGLQAPCISFSSATMSRDPYTAFLQGAWPRLTPAHGPPLSGLFPGSPIYFDMEGYNNADAGCVAAVQGFIDGWVLQLHQSGYARRHVQQSAVRASSIRPAVFGTPGNYPLDAIWIAAWAFNDQNDPRYATYVPGLSGFTGCGAALAGRRCGPTTSESGSSAVVTTRPTPGSRSTSTPTRSTARPRDDFPGFAGHGTLVTAGSESPAAVSPVQPTKPGACQYRLLSPPRTTTRTRVPS